MSCATDGRLWAQKVAKALASTFCSLDEAFAQTAMPSGPPCTRILSQALLTDVCIAGATVSLALICGSLLTVANVGDSEVFLDTLSSILPLTDSHKVETNTAEQDR